MAATLQERLININLIQFIRRDDRAAEGVRLEVVCTRKGTEGSNPSLSGKKHFVFFNSGVLLCKTPQLKHEGFET